MQSTVPQKKNKKWYQKIFSVRRESRQPRGKEKNREVDTCIPLVIKPLRIFQFLVVLLIFVLVVYTIMLDDFKLSSLMCILLIVLTGVYLFVLSIDLIYQFIGEDMHVVSMFIFSFLGTLFFGAAGIFLLAAHAFNAPWYVLTIACALILTWILFIIDILLIMVFWKRSCISCKPCCYPKQTEILQQQNICHPVCLETVKCDLMTSVSSVKVPSGDENAVPDHSSRKIGYGRRRQYVDCPTSARALCFADAANVQTEQQETSTVHCQAKQETKETPVQTVSKCELCNRQIQIFYNSATSPQIPQVCAPCPALAQLLSGSGCCPGCRCVTGIIQVPQQSQQQQTQRMMKPSNEDKEPTKDQRWMRSKDKKSNELLTSKECQLQDPKVTGTITKLTLASYCMSPKKTTVSCQTNTSKLAKQTSGNAKRNSEDLASGKTTVNAEKEKLDVKKKTDNLVKEKERDKMNSILKKGPRSSIKRSSESAEEKPLEASKKITTESSTKKQDVPNKKEASVIVAEKPIESSKKEMGENSARKSIESPMKEVANSVRKNETLLVEGKSHEMNNEKLNTIGQKRFNSPQTGDKLSENTTGEGNTSDSKNFSSRENTENSRRRSTNIRTALSISRLRNLSTDSDASISSNHTGIETEGQEETDGVEKNKVKDKKNVKEKRSDSKDRNNQTKRRKSDRKTKSEDEVENRATNLGSSGRKIEKSLETDTTHKPDVGTQTIANEHVSRSKRTYGLWKKNKIEPAEYTDTNIQTASDNDAKPSTSKQTEGLSVKDSSLTDRGVENICPACKKLQEPTAPSNSQQYYNIYKDHRGRAFCEYCATPNTVKILFKTEDRKRLKCAGCGQFMRVKCGQNVRNKSDSCPHCGQGQGYVQSAVSA